MTETPQETFARVNTPRVEKILAMLDTIDKSAASNKVDASSIYGPIRDRLGNPTPLMLPPGVTAPAPAGKNHWSSCIDMARNAPLEDAVAAMQVVATRLEQHLYEERTK